MQKTETILITGGLALWFFITFGVAYFARELRFDFFGWPFSYWVAAQGSLIVYCLILALHAYVMNKHEAAAALEEQAPP